MSIRGCISLIVVTGALYHSAAQAAITLYFDPTPQDVVVGQSFSVDILADLAAPTAVDDLISAFDFTVTYDSLILLPTRSVTFGNFLDGGIGLSIQGTRYPDDPDFPTAPSTFEVAELSFLTDEALAGMQNPPDPITLVSMEFVALSETTASTVLSISFVNDDPAKLAQDVKGRNFTVLTVNTSPGFVNVAAVPVPTTAALLALGLLGVGAARRRAA